MNVLIPGKHGSNPKRGISQHMSGIMSIGTHVELLPSNATEHLWLQVTIGLGNGLVPSVTKT